MDGPVSLIKRLRTGEQQPVGLFDDLRGQNVLSWDWGQVKLQQFRAELLDVPEGVVLNPVIGTYVAGSPTLEHRFASDLWKKTTTPLHSIAVFPEQVPYALRNSDKLEFFHIEIASAFASDVLWRSGGGGQLRPVVGLQDTFAKHVLFALAEEAQLGRELGAIRAESLAVALLSHLAALDARPVPAPMVAVLSSPKLRRVLDYVAANIDSPLTLRSLANVAEMDLFRFVRAFKQSTGLSPHRYVLEARINKAKELLRQQSLSITDIALATGFSTPSHFSVTFRRIAGVTPREFRGGGNGS